MKAVLLFLYVGMAVWLLISAALRIVLLLRSGSDLDPLPFISAGLGLLALVLMFAAHSEARERREQLDDR